MRCPRRGRQRGGRHDEGVHRHDVALRPRQRRRPRLGGPQHVAGPHDGARPGGHPARLEGQHAGALVDGGAPPLDRLGEAAHERPRLDAGAVGGPRRPVDPVALQALSRRRPVEPGRRQAPPRVVGDAGAGARHLGRAAGHDRLPPLRKPQSMPSSAARAPRSSTDSRSAATMRPGRLGAVLAGDGVEPDRVSAETQPPLRPLAPKPDVLGLEHDHAQRRVEPQQVVGGPQTREAPTDDDDVDLGVGGQCGTRRREVGAVPHRGAVTAAGGGGGAAGSEVRRRAGEHRAQARGRSRRTRAGRWSAAARAG